MAKTKKDKKEDRVLTEIAKDQEELDKKRKDRINELAIENVTGLSSSLDKLHDRIESFYECNVDNDLLVDGDKTSGEMKSNVKAFTAAIVKISYGENYRIVNRGRVKKMVPAPDTFNANELQNKLIQSGIIEGSGEFLGMQDINVLLFGDTDTKMYQKHKPLHKKYP